MSREGVSDPLVSLLRVALAFLMLSALAPPGLAWDRQEVRVAVAANFTEPVKEIGAMFEQASGDKLVLSFGATGQFYAQISQGAPFDVLLAADKATPDRAISEGHARAGSAYTYAVGKLVLFSKSGELVKGEATLKEARFANIAIANPLTAPYGVAAVETLRALGVYDAIQPKIVRGNNIAQTFQFIETGNAELGFIALSQVIFVPGGSRWIVPATLHTPIAQDAVLLRAGENNTAAKAFLAFLKGPEARAVIEKYGYGAGE